MDDIEEREIKTENGIELYSLDNCCLHGFYLALYVRAGSMYEPIKENGISHFTEHLVFKNINYIYKGRLYEILDSECLEFNAVTYKEFIQFTISGLPSHAEKAVEIFMHIFDEMLLSENDIETERNRVAAEIREENDKASLTYFSKKLVWKGTPLAETITGLASALKRISFKRLKEFKREILSPDNIFICVSGNTEKLLNKLKPEIEKLKLAGNTKNLNFAPVPVDFTNRNLTFAVKPGNFLSVGMFFDFKTDEISTYALDLMYDIIFAADSGAMFRELSDKNGYIYSFDSNTEFYPNIGNMGCKIRLSYANLYEVLEIFVHILNNIKTGGFNLEFVRPYYTEMIDMCMDSTEDLNFLFSYDRHILGLKYGSINEYKKMYVGVTAEMISETARKIFITDNLVFTLSGNKKKIDENKIREIFSALDKF